MQSYFLKQISVAQYFTPKLDQYEINYSVVQQLPGHARDALVTIAYEDTNHVARAIAQLDMTYEDSRSRDGRRNPINGNASQNTTSSQGYSTTQGKTAGGWRGGAGQASNSGQAFGQSYRARGLDVSQQPWYPLPNVSRPPPVFTGDNLYVNETTINPEIGDLNQRSNLNE